LHEVPFFLALERDVVTSIERMIQVNRFRDRSNEIADMMSKGVDQVVNVLVLASKVVTEKNQTDNYYAQDAGFETLKKFNGRLTVLRHDILDMEVEMESAVTLISSGANELGEWSNMHTGGADLMWKLNVLLTEVQAFLSELE